MAHDTNLADQIREYLVKFPELKVEEKLMFGGLTFMVNDKMCVCVSGEDLMCRFDPGLQTEFAEKNGYQPMIMNEKDYKGFCYINPTGFKSGEAFAYWMDLCLDYNKKAKASKKNKLKA